MTIRRFSFFVGLAAFLLLTVFFSCKDAGLGSAVDLIPPVVTLESHSHMDYVPTHITLGGSWSDNQGLSRVSVLVISSQQEYNAIIEGNRWLLDLDLAAGEQVLRVTAYDLMQNSGNNSVVTVTLLVDETPPFVDPGSLRVKRATGISTPLLTETQLAGSSLNLFAHIDRFQNKFFSISGSSVEDFRIKTLAVDLVYNDAVLLTKTIDSSNNILPANTTGSVYNWNFGFSEAELISANAALITGRHNIKVVFRMTDYAGNSSENAMGWVCWYPESDNPRLSDFNTVNGVLTCQREQQLIFYAVDDDAVSNGYYKVFSSADWAGVEADFNAGAGDAWSSFISSNSLNDLGLSGDLRSISISIPAPSASGLYRLVYVLTDNGGVAGAGSIPLDVVDDDPPLLFFTSPDENTVPVLTGGSVLSIQGYTLDNYSLNSLKAAWMPDGLYNNLGGSENALAAVKAAFDSAPSLPHETAQGIRLWEIPVGAEESVVSGSRVYAKNSFQTDLDIFTDFLYNGSIENEIKRFYFFAYDSGGNSASQTFRLAADTVSPQLTISEPAVELMSHDLHDDLNLTFSAEKANGLSMDPGSFEIIDVESALSLPLTQNGDGSFSTVVSSSGLVEGNRVFEFHAADSLGNQIVKRRTVHLTDLPVLTKITSTMADRTYKAGDDITLQAVFSKQVEVTGVPVLNLKDSNSGTSYTADYISGSGTDTLLFRFTVQPGQVSSCLLSLGDALDLPGGASIITTEGNGGDAVLAVLAESASLQADKQIQLDGVAPEVTDVTVPAGSFSEGDSLSVEVEFSEDIMVSGVPFFKFTTAGVQADYITNSSRVVTFRYTVSSGIDVDPLSYDLDQAFLGCISWITDRNGNPLTVGSSPVSVTSAIIDTTPPASPSLSIAAGIYNTPQTLTLGDLETGSDSWYSLNGGLTWNSYTAPVTVPPGDYNITAYQKDSARNDSPGSAPVSVSIDNVFPEIISVSCDKPDGNYPAGETLVFSLFFSHAVTSSNSAFLTLGGGAGTANVIAQATGQKTLKFSYTIPPGLELDPVTLVNADLTGVEDAFGNSVSGVITSSTTPSLPDLNRPGLKVESIAPVLDVSSCLPYGSHLQAAGDRVITLEFSENVYKESGNITIRRDGAWLIPPVLSLEDFQEVYYSSALSDADKELLMETDGGFPKTDPVTGQAVGPYRPVTHGLENDGGVFSPDTTTKYVLDFDSDLDDSAIRDVLEKAGYHQYIIDVSSSQVSVSGSTVTITLNEALPVGETWEVLMDAGSFRDAGGNTVEELTEDTWLFQTDQVSTPVIRVERMSHDDKFNAPSGQVRVRIDSQTRNAVIHYLTVEDNDTIPGTPLFLYGGIFTVGDGSYNIAQKIFIKAVASLTDLIDSDFGYEGAFKTVICFDNPVLQNNYYVNAPDKNGYEAQDPYNYLYLHGSTNRSGPPTVMGFPLRDASSDPRFSKRMYRSAGNDSGGNTTWYWVSWEIISDFAMVAAFCDDTPNWEWVYNPDYPVNGKYAKDYLEGSYGERKDASGQQMEFWW